MCGLFGVVSEPGRFDRADIVRGLDSLRHRGPDDSGVEIYLLADREIWLGHRRLSIVDLSEAGRQPMEVQGPRGRGVIVFNGELYNHRELRPTLADRHDFRTGSDTEVLLAGLLHEGPSFLQQTNAMLAFALLDFDAQHLTLARDRVGKKPLYTYEADGVFAFASELKAFEALGLPLTIDEDAFAYFRWLGYFPAKLTAYRECRKLEAGVHEDHDLRVLGEQETTQYWDPFAGYGRHFSGSYNDAIDEFLVLLDDATKLRLDADVPVGAFLSGGIDSSLVASSIQKLHAGGVEAFTVGSDDPAFDESDVARETAARLGITIHVLDIQPADYERQIAGVPYHYDEPLGDSSQIPTMAISEKAKEHVTVVLTGDGGDELFLGYPWFGYPEKLWAWRTRFAPGAMARKLAAASLETAAGRRVLKGVAGAIGLNVSNIETKRLIARHALLADSPAALYDRFRAVWQPENLSKRDRAVLGERTLTEHAKAWYPRYSWSNLEARTLSEQFAGLDQVTYMRDDVLVKVDRATMAYGLEARSPLLDWRIVEFAGSLPAEFKCADGTYKRLLRDAVERRTGSHLSKLKKLGFGVPLPPNLPEAPTTAAQWSLFVEQGWRRER